jgi:hypothetical protein
LFHEAIAQLAEDGDGSNHLEKLLDLIIFS